MVTSFAGASTAENFAEAFNEYSSTELSYDWKQFNASWNSKGCGCWPTTNEAGHKYVITNLTKAPLEGDTIVAAGCFTALNIASAVSSIRYILITDINESVKNFWDDIQIIILSSSTRDEALHRVRGILESKYRVNADGKLTSPLFEREMTESISWLSDDAKFLAIKRIFSEKHFAFVQADMTKERQIQPIAAKLTTLGHRVSVIYTSNIDQYVIGVKREVFPNLLRDTVRHLVTGSAVHVFSTSTAHEMTVTLETLMARSP